MKRSRKSRTKASTQPSSSSQSSDQSNAPSANAHNAADSQSINQRSHNAADSQSINQQSNSQSSQSNIHAPTDQPDQLDVDTQRAATVMSNCVVEGTKVKYASKLKMMRKFFHQKQIEQHGTLPFIAANVMKFFGYLAGKDTQESKKPMAVSTMRSYKSALKYAYREKKIPFPIELDDELEQFLDGWTREVSSLKQQGKMKVFEGKLPLSFDAYCTLAQAAFKMPNAKQMMFVWSFLVLQWNLLARSESVANIMLPHISWLDDALVIATPKSKADQEGVKCFARHLYANPANPTICPVLALALLVFGNSFFEAPTSRDDEKRSQSVDQSTAHAASSVAPVLGSISQSSAPEEHIEQESEELDEAFNRNFPLYPGSNTENHYSTVLRKLIEKLDPESKRALGCAPNQIGTHSIRKGAATYCTSLLSGPTAIQVFLRAGWSLGPVQDRYLFGGGGGDQLTGRVLAGLPLNDRLFSQLAPHFDAEGLRLINWNEILPGHLSYPVGFQAALPFLLASIIYHRDFLVSSLAPSHPLLSSFLFTSNQIPLLRPHVHSGLNKSPVSNLTAHGIPPHITVSNEVHHVGEQVQQLQRSLIEKCDSIPTVLEQLLTDRFTINGVVPVNRHDLEIMFQTHFERISSLGIGRNDNSSPVSVPNTEASMFDMFTWGGALHMVPEGWHIPKAAVKETWKLWFFGNSAARIRPLRFLHSADLLNDTEEQLASRIRGLFYFVCSTGIDAGLIAQGARVEALSLTESMVFFDAAFPLAAERLESGSTAKEGWSTRSITTWYKCVAKVDKDTRKRMRDSGRSASNQQRQRRRVETDQAVAQSM